MRKYEFTGEERGLFCIVKRIRAVRDFGNVKKGDLGGWIESEKNLSHDDLCWVGDDAIVFENARVGGDAQVKGNARVGGNAQVFENAQVYGNAQICGYAVVRGNAKVRRNSKIGGYAWVYGNALVYGNAIVCGHAGVYGFARIGSPKDIFTASNVGSENGTLTAYRTKTGGVEVTRGCFGGTLDEFAEAVNHKHGNSQEGKEYRALIEFLQIRFSVEDVA